MKKTEVIKKITLFFKTRQEVIAVYLFGSYAKNREQKDSDIDLAVILDHNTIIHQNDFQRQYYIGLAQTIRKDVHIVIINNAGENILAQVFKYGKCIFNRDPEIISRFQMVRFAMIADFAYQRNIMKEGFIRRFIGESH